MKLLDRHPSLILWGPFVLFWSVLSTSYLRAAAQDLPPPAPVEPVAAECPACPVCAEPPACPAPCIVPVPAEVDAAVQKALDAIRASDAAEKQ